MLSEARFRQALTVALDEQQFVNLPVDWWDGDESRWRPTLIEALAPLNFGERSTVQIASPLRDHEDADNIADLPVRVPISLIRPSQLIDEGLSAFYASRYALSVLDKLISTISSDSPQESDFVASLGSWLTAYSTGYEYWHSRFQEGASNGEASCYVVGDSVDQLELRGIGEQRLGFFATIAVEKACGNVHVAPVAWWDESASSWRPTLIIGAASDEHQFEAATDVTIIAPGKLPETKTVSGASLSPLSLDHIPWQMLAIPIIGVDMVRVSDALESASATQNEIASHPTHQKMKALLANMTEQWTSRWLAGIEAEPPEASVIQLDPSVWTFPKVPAGVSEEDA